MRGSRRFVKGLAAGAAAAALAIGGMAWGTITTTAVAEGNTWSSSGAVDPLAEGNTWSVAGNTWS